MISGGDELARYASDETEDLSFPPEVVVKARSTEEVSRIMKYCSGRKIPVTPRGAGTGLSGGSIPVFGGLSLSLERMNSIIDVDGRNLQVVVEPGVITQVLQEKVAESGLFYPPDPASRGSCFIGGNIAENSGGPRAVKYGVTSNYVLNLEVVLPGGNVIWTGANVLKNATGYNLTQLMVGSEGSLGIVTKAVLRLIPLPKYDKLMLIPFYSGEDACRAVTALLRAGISPSALEFMERDAIQLASEFLASAFDPGNGIEAHLLLEIDGNDEGVILNEVEKANEILSSFRTGEIQFAESDDQKGRLWKLRRCMGEAVKSFSVYKEEDTVVPRAELPRLLSGIKEIGRKYGFRSVCYGHAGDGNLHVNILREGMDDKAWNETVREGIREIFKLCVSLGGTISGEHGIGLVQKPYLDIAFDKYQMEIQKRIKEAFDPGGILNPGKIFPDYS